MIVAKIIDFTLHVDKYIEIIIANFGVLTYFILFLIIFCETGLVITPFLPGDSLLFISGTFAAKGIMNIFLLFTIFSIAAIIGDSFNFWIGSYFGERVFSKSRFFKQEYLNRTKEFYSKYGGKTIILARFVPFLRTFAPFVAGIGKMNYTRFIFYNIIGGLAWVSLFLFSGYFFGKIPFVMENLTLFVYGIVFVSIIPILFEFTRNNLKKRRLKKTI